MEYLNSMIMFGSSLIVHKPNMVSDGDEGPIPSLLEDLFAALFTQHLPVIVTEPVDTSIHTNKPVTVM